MVGDEISFLVRNVLKYTVMCLSRQMDTWDMQNSIFVILEISYRDSLQGFPIGIPYRDSLQASLVSMLVCVLGEIAVVCCQALEADA